MAMQEHIADTHALCGLIDVALITIVEREKEVLQDILSLEDAKVDHLYGEVLFTYGWITQKIGGRRLSVAVFSMGRTNMGNTYTAALTTLIHSKLMPRLSIITGIAAGLKTRTVGDWSYSGLKIGTIVVPDRVFDSTVAEVRPTADPAEGRYRMESYRADMYRIGSAPETIGRELSTELLEQVRAYRDGYLRAVYPNWGKSNFRFSQPASSRLTPGEWSDYVHQYVENDISVDDHMIASSNMLLKDAEVLQRLHRIDARIRSADMESSGFARASQLCSADWMAIRGVSDFGDTEKSDEFHELACANIASYIKVFLESKIKYEYLSKRPERYYERRLERFEQEAKAILESYATSFLDILGIRINLEIYWVHRQLRRNPSSGHVEVILGVIRHGVALTAERDSGLNRNNSRMFFPFNADSPRVVAQCGETGVELFHRVLEGENTPLKWVYACPLFSDREGTRKTVGVICCTSTEDRFRDSQSGTTKEVWESDLLRLSATIGTLRDLLHQVCEACAAYDLIGDSMNTRPGWGVSSTMG